MSIHRIEYKQSGAWRLVRDEKSKYFSDLKYGGKKESLQAAEDFDKALPPKRTPSVYNIETHPEIFAQVRKKSGVVGVHGMIIRNSYKDQYIWVASKGSGKTRRIRHFNVKKYGPLALQMAIEARQAWDAEQKKGNV